MNRRHFQFNEKAFNKKANENWAQTHHGIYQKKPTPFHFSLPCLLIRISCVLIVSEFCCGVNCQGCFISSISIHHVSSLALFCTHSLSHHTYHWYFCLQLWSLHLIYLFFSVHSSFVHIILNVKFWTNRTYFFNLFCAAAVV